MSACAIPDTYISEWLCPPSTTMQEPVIRSGAVRREKGAQVSHRLGPAEPAHRKISVDELFHNLRRLLTLEPLPAPAGVQYRAGRDRVDRYSTACERKSRVLRLGDHRRLGGHVADVPAVLASVDRGYVDDPSPALLLHVRQREARKLVSAEQVEVEDRSVVAERRARQVCRSRRAACVVHQDVQRTQIFHRLIVEARNVVDLRNVRHDAERLDAHILKLGHGPVDGALSPSAYRDVHALRRQRQSALTPQATAASGDERVTPGYSQVHWMVLPSFCRNWQGHGTPDMAHVHARNRHTISWQGSGVSCNAGTLDALRLCSGQASAPLRCAQHDRGRGTGGILRDVRS